MSNYEFWNEMDKIFDAVLAYQEKTIEFNKRFINPWVSLGNVFEKQEKNDVLAGYRNAVELDPKNAQNWCDLANTFGGLGNFQEAIQAYQKALELGLKSGKLYTDMAFAHTMIGKYQEALPLFEKGLVLLEKDSDKAAILNQIGNLYRKLNNYKLALKAFQAADRLENKDHMHGKPVDPERAAVENVGEAPLEEVVSTLDKNTAFEPIDEPATAIASNSNPEETSLLTEEQSIDAESKNNQEEDKDIEDEKEDNSLPVIFDFDFSGEASTDFEEDLVSGGVEEEFEEDAPVSEFVAALERESGPAPAPARADLEKDDAEEEELTWFSTKDFTVPFKASGSPNPVVSDSKVKVKIVDFSEEPTLDTPRKGSVFTEEANSPRRSVPTLRSETGFQGEVQKKSEKANDFVPSNKNQTMTVFSAYEEYLSDNSGPVGVNLSDHTPLDPKETSTNPIEVEAPKAKANLDGRPKFSANMDTKNAQVWNELGSVYFNAGSYDDAIAAYTRAIELDKKFAWPYSNLALTYVQKGRYEDAVLLYQRGIELFTNDRDKAATWNRLGDLYRCMNDYESAIASYQRADDLDPSKKAITNPSRYSLLGNEKVNQEVGFSM